MKKNSNEKLYEVIIKNRYKISIVMLVISTILGFFINSIDVKEWFLSNIKFYALVLASYELFYIITNENKAFSFVGMIVITLSGFVQFNFANIDSLILGEIITVLVYKILIKDNLKLNMLMSLFVILGSICYVYTFRPYAISFGYIFLSLIIFELIHFRDFLKKNKSKVVLLVFTLIISVVGALLANIFLYKNNGETTQNISFGISGLFSYLYNPLLPFNKFELREVFGSFISVFPIPLVIALLYLYKNEKHADFLLPIVIVTVIETIFCISGFPVILEKITMFDGIEDLRVMPAINLANVFIMFYILSNIDEKMFEMKHAIRITLLAVCILVFIRYPNIFGISKKYLYLFSVELSMLAYLLLNYKDKRYQKVLMFCLILLTLISGLPISFII